MRRLLALGAGGHGCSVAAAVLSAGSHKLVGFMDDAVSAPNSVWDVPVLGSMVELGAYRQYAELAIVAIGNNAAREVLSSRLLAAGFELAAVLHPQCPRRARKLLELASV